MKMPKAGAVAVDEFRALLGDLEGATERPVFGQPAAFVRGNMFFGVFGEHVFVRLSDADRVAAASEIGAQPFEPMPGRPMREYVVLPPKALKDRKVASAWTARSLAYALSLPAKSKTKK